MKGRGGVGRGGRGGGGNGPGGDPTAGKRARAESAVSVSIPSKREVSSRNFHFRLFEEIRRVRKGGGGSGLFRRVMRERNKCDTLHSYIISRSLGNVQVAEGTNHSK